MELSLILIVLSAILLSFLLGFLIAKKRFKLKTYALADAVNNFEKRIITLSDTLKPVLQKSTTKTRNEKQKKQDAVLQLQNEIATSGALKFVELEDGTQKVELTVLL